MPNTFNKKNNDIEKNTNQSSTSTSISIQVCELDFLILDKKILI